MKILLILCLLPFSALSGIRVVGNPSGYIENQIVYTWVHLKESLSTCLKTESCAVSADEKRFVAALVNTFQKDSPKLLFYSLNEKPLMGSRLSLIEKTNQQLNLIINVDELYKKYNEPSFFELKNSLQVLLESLRGIAPEFSNLEVSNLVQNLFYLSFKKETTLSTEAFGLKEIYFKLVGLNSNQLLVNDDSGMTSLNPSLTAKVPCPEGPALITSFKWISIKGYDRSQNKLALDSLAEYSCQKANYVANLFVIFPVTTAKTLDLSALVLSIRNRQQK